MTGRRWARNSSASDSLLATDGSAAGVLADCVRRRYASLHPPLFTATYVAARKVRREVLAVKLHANRSLATPPLRGRESPFTLLSSRPSVNDERFETRTISKSSTLLRDEGKSILEIELSRVNCPETGSVVFAP